MPTLTAERALSHDARLRTQALLDEGDTFWFARHPDESSRIRMYFLGERVEGGGQPTRYIRVFRQPDGTLLRRFEQEGDAR